MSNEAELLPGTLDLLILKAVSLGPLYPALFRLVRQGLLKAEWDKSDNNRRAKFYELTRKGRKRLREETDWWNRVAAAVATVIAAEPENA